MLAMPRKFTIVLLEGDAACCFCFCHRPHEEGTSINFYDPSQLFPFCMRSMRRSCKLHGTCNMCLSDPNKYVLLYTPRQS